MDYGKYLALTLATIFVIVGQFAAARIWIVLALSLYVVAGAFMFATSTVHAVEIYAADGSIKSEHLEAASAEEVKTRELKKSGEEIGEKQVEVVDVKAEKGWSVASSIFYGLFTIFALVVLILY